MRTLATWWAIGGFSALLLWAIWRLSLVTAESLSEPLDWRHWLLLLANLAFMAYTEGYRGFQLGYSPRLARRVIHLRDAGSAGECLLAPLYVMGYFGAPRARLITTYVLTLAIVALIVLFHQISQPWRGILDAGVVVGLTWGLVSTWIHTGSQLTGGSQITEEYR